MGRTHGVAIDRLTSRWSRGESGVDASHARRVWLQTLLSGCDLVPPAMPPSATLVVRRLTDPLPGRIARSQHAVRPEPEWEQAVRSQLSDLWRAAARPERGLVPAEAEAVLFADPAEQAAALALDLAAGEAGSRWWWRALLPGQIGRCGLAAYLARQPAQLPATLAYLAAWQRVQPVAGALTPAEAQRLALVMGGAFGLPDWRAGAGSAVGLVPAGAAAPGRRPTGTESVSPPWVQVLGGAADLHLHGLGPAQALLVGLGLALAARPTVVRSPRFIAALRTWWTAAADPNGPGPGSPGPGNSGPGSPGLWPVRPGSAADTGRRLGSPERAPHGVDGGRLGGRTAPARPSEAGPGAQPAAVEDGTATPGEAGVDGWGGLPRQSGLASAGSAPTRSGATFRPVTPAESGDLAGDWPPAQTVLEGLETGLGGVLFLINLMRYLDLGPAALGEELGPWGLLEALARALLPAGAGADLASDPIWPALAQLDGREVRTLPGAGLAPQAELRLPASWPFGAEVPAPADLAGTLAAGLNPALRGWLARVAPCLHHRLGQAMAVPEPALHLLLVPGRLHITATHVDLTIDIERTSIAIRLAGLDRDPGWLPDFGRVVLFHFV